MTDQILEAVKAGDKDRIEILLNENPELAGAQAESGVSAVLIALYHGKREIAEMLASRRNDLSVFEAAALGAVERLRELLDADPSLANICACDGFHPLGLACFFGHEPSTQLLIERGADVTAPSANALRVQPMHSAAARKATAIVKLLIEHGADPNARQQTGYAPLHAAAQNGDAATVEILLAGGADIAPASDDGRTPAQLAEEAGHLELAARLGDHRR